MSTQPQPNHGHGTTLQVGSLTTMKDKQSGETHEVKIVARRVVGWLAEDVVTGTQFVLFE